MLKSLRNTQQLGTDPTFWNAVNSCSAADLFQRISILQFPNRLISSLFILRRSGTKKNKREISHPIILRRSGTKKNKREISHPVILRNEAEGKGPKKISSL